MPGATLHTNPERAPALQAHLKSDNAMNSNRPQGKGPARWPLPQLWTTGSRTEGWEAAVITKWAEARGAPGRWRSTRQPSPGPLQAHRLRGCNSALSDTSSGHARRRAASPVWTVLELGRQDSSQCLLVSPSRSPPPTPPRAPEGGPHCAPHSLEGSVLGTSAWARLKQPGWVLPAATCQTRAMPAHSWSPHCTQIQIT